MKYVLTAQRNGADRVELCAVPKGGGLTPSLGVLKSVCQRVMIPVHPIIHPCGGDFRHSDGGFTAILEGMRAVHELGFPGLVTGALDVDGNVDMPQMEKIIAAAGPLVVTFHRAFDMCTNPLDTLNSLTELGIVRVLTPGQKSDALQDLSEVTELIVHCDTPIIMAETGTRVENLRHSLDVGVLEVHSSVGAWQASPIRYRNQELSMSLDAYADKYSRYIVDGAVVAEMKGIVERYQAKWFLPLHHVTQYDAYSYQASATSTKAFLYP